MQSIFKKLLHEPLVHFLLLALLIFAVSAVVHRGEDQNKRIKVDHAELTRLQDSWTQQWGKPPNAAELNNLVQEYVKEEVLYREALAEGLDRGDTIIRRRLVQKMQYVAQGVTTPPSNAELQNYFSAHAEKYRTPAQIGFTHIYFSSSRRGPAAEADARAALPKILSGSKTAALGDPFMLESEYAGISQQQVAELFGEEFAAAVFQLTPGQWAGPVKSSYGCHLVRVESRVESKVPELSDVREQVIADMTNAKLQQASDAFYAKLRKQYTVEVDTKDLGQTEATSGAPKAAQQPQ